MIRPYLPRACTEQTHNTLVTLAPRRFDHLRSPPRERGTARAWCRVKSARRVRVVGGAVGLGVCKRAGERALACAHTNAVGSPHAPAHPCSRIMFHTARVTFIVPSKCTR
jgi:hypothetical protein